MDPITASIIIAALMGGSNAAGGSIAASKKSKNDRAMSDQAQGLEESAMDPFRAANAQTRAMRSVDRRLNTTPLVTGVDGSGYADLTGGDYTMSPEMTNFLTEMRKRIAAGTAQNPGITPMYKSGVQNMLPRPNPGQKYTIVNGQAVPF